ncbi:MAG TPA: NAD(P)/FAD-dependent oxidoreductase, partial [Bauldia sp.]|nr:NAD(P)/FAD-dependent oxidoreductase [Bauldia sp.]
DAAGRFNDVYDMLTMSAHDYLRRWFESDAAMVALGYYPAGAAGQSVSIHTPGTAYLLLRSELRDSTTPAGGTGLVRGGMGTVTGAIAQSGRRFGLETRTDAKVAAITVRDGRATAVVLESGEEIAAKAVIANADARSVFLKLLDPKVLPDDLMTRIRGYRSRFTSFKIHLALAELPRYRGFDAAAAGFPYPAQMRIAPSLDYMEAAYTDMLRGKVSERPFLTVMAPTVVDPGLAPAGHHILSVYGGHVPVADPLVDDIDREALYATACRVISEFAPGFEASVLHRQILTPWDYQEIFALPGGHPHQGDIGLDQLFFRRPVPHSADYRTPVRGLYLCGSSSHPGGGVTGVPGHNAARVVLRDWKRKLN